MTLKSVSIVLLASLSLAACGGGSRGPDEFEVLERAPLVVPPEAELTPPRPGEPRAQEIDPGQAAYEALFPGKTLNRSTPKSQSEYGLLRRLAQSDPDIRSNVGGGKKADVVKKKLLLADLLDADERTHRPDNIEIYKVSGSE
jgi:hypothetical protein